jgi:hypothetical protein
MDMSPAFVQVAKEIAPSCDTPGLADTLGLHESGDLFRLARFSSHRIPESRWHLVSLLSLGLLILATEIDPDVFSRNYLLGSCIKQARKVQSVEFAVESPKSVLGL